MVDALHEAHAVLRPGGTLIDLRPDSSHPPLVRWGRTEIGGLYERREAVRDHRASDRAVARVVGEGQFRLIRAGQFWYALPKMDLRALDAWVAQSRRIGGFTRGTRAALAKDPEHLINVRRALAYGIYRRI